MTYYGHVENGLVVLDDTPNWPEGARVAVAVLEPAVGEKDHEPIWKVAIQMGEAVPSENLETLPTDGARNLDHYLYGAAKKDA
jgi:hypothetical protein